MWYPAAANEVDQDGRTRLFPIKVLLSAWWGDWNQNGTPEDLMDDVVVRALVIEVLFGL